MALLLATVSSLVPWLSLVLPVAGGVLALAALRRPPIRDRPDRRRAIRGSITLGIGLGGLSAVIGAGLSNTFLGDPDLASAIPVGLGVGALISLSALAGYALLARLQVRQAVAGCALGPFFLVVLPLYVASWAGHAARLAS
jgi:hypothetical protein